MVNSAKKIEIKREKDEENLCKHEDLIVLKIDLLYCVDNIQLVTD